MSLLSPTAVYGAELREQLGLVGRALALQRALTWLVRGLALGLIVDLGVVGWAWTREAVGSIPLPLLVGTPVALALLTGLGQLLRRRSPADLARRVDQAAGLQERAVTALELGSRGLEHPLAVAQMRDAVEHLKRLEPLETFPPRAPKRELILAAAVAATSALLAVSPNPWLLSARVANPKVTAAQEQAQKVERLANSLPADNTAELNQLRDLLSKGAKTIDARSSDPEQALTALEDLEQKVRDMSASDGQLAASLAAIASALAGDSATKDLAAAINTGDMHQISQAAKDLAQRTAKMDSQEQQRVAKVLRDASAQAGSGTDPVARDLAKAADALQSGAAGQQGANGDASAASAQQALNDLSQSATAAGERQSAQNGLQSSRNALERALGRTESRSVSSSSSAASQGQGQSQSQSQSQGQGQSQGQNQDQGTGQNGGNPGQGASQNQDAGADQGQPGGSSGGSNDNNGQPGGGYSTGGQNMNKTGNSTSLDSVTRPQQVPSDGSAPPDYSSANPNLSNPSSGQSQVTDEQVNPSYQRRSTQGNDNATIPLGLRDLVKDYFSSLDHK